MSFDVNTLVAFTDEDLEAMDYQKLYFLCRFISIHISRTNRPAWVIYNKAFDIREARKTLDLLIRGD